MAALSTCAVCGKRFWPGRPYRSGPIACGPTCATRLRYRTDATVAAVLMALVKPVVVRPDGRHQAVLCLEPLKPAALSKRRAQLRHAGEG